MRALWLIQRTYRQYFYATWKGNPSTRCVIINGTPNFQGKKFSQYLVYLHKHIQANAWDNAVWSASRIVHHIYTVLPLPCSLSQCDVNVEYLPYVQPLHYGTHQHVSAPQDKHPFRRGGRWSEWSVLQGRPVIQQLLPDIRQLSDFYAFQRDSAPTHRARETVDLFTKETPDFIRLTLWPPNGPDLNSVDYKVWSVMQQKVYKKRIKDVDKLRAHILTAFDELDQRVIDTAVRQRRTRLRACQGERRTLSRQT